MIPVKVEFNLDSQEATEFKKCKDMYNTYQSCIAKEVDCSNPVAIVQHLAEIAGVLGMGAVCKARLEYLTDKLSTKALMNIRDVEGSANERKVMLAFSIGDCSFYNNVMELLIKEAHYKVEILRTSLSYCKSELSLG
tara:strand:+ start:83 stop:493 length:411 start_codon:yes stop_codon:yes gene_type:complete